MHPSVTEQLRGIRHILGEVIAPQIADPYSVSILDGLMAALEGLADGWSQVPRFLRWDAEQSAALLVAALPYLNHEVAEQLRSAFADAPEGDLDVVALQEHHRRVRAVLERAIPDIVGAVPAAGQSEVAALVVQHLRARVEEYPFIVARPVPPTPPGGLSAYAAR